MNVKWKYSLNNCLRFSVMKYRLKIGAKKKKRTKKNKGVKSDYKFDYYVLAITFIGLKTKTAAYQMIAQTLRFVCIADLPKIYYYIIIIQCSLCNFRCGIVLDRLGRAIVRHQYAVRFKWKQNERKEGKKRKRRKKILIEMVCIIVWVLDKYATDFPVDHATEENEHTNYNSIE